MMGWWVAVVTHNGKTILLVGLVGAVIVLTREMDQEGPGSLHLGTSLTRLPPYHRWLLTVSDHPPPRLKGALADAFDKTVSLFTKANIGSPYGESPLHCLVA